VTSWVRLFLEVAAIFAIFHASAAALGSDRGQAGILVGALVVAATLAAQRARSRETIASGWRGVGLGPPRIGGLIASAAACVLLLLVVPAFARSTGTTVSVEPDSLWLLPGLFAQAGVAEETLFRGYLFGQLRRGRSFWQAASLSMLPFVAVHLLLFATMPWAVALAALLLAVVTSFPFAHLYEVGGATIWPPALVHFVVQGTVKVVLVSEEAAPMFPLAWMAASATLPLVVFVVPRPTR
jgi:membrane protease YdiL (CAAX protease family)